MLTKYARGMVYWVNLPERCNDPVITGKRPCIIVSNDILNVKTNTVMVVPCTSNINRVYTQATRTALRILGPNESVALCEFVMPVPKELCTDFIGILDVDTMRKIDKTLAIAVGLADVPAKIEPEETVKIVKSETVTKQTRLKGDLNEKEKAKAQYMEDYENHGPEYVVKKYKVASKSAAIRRYYYYRKALTEETE